MPNLNCKANNYQSTAVAVGLGANDEEPIDPIGEGFDVPDVASGRFVVVLEKSE